MANETYLKRHRVWQKHAEKELAVGRKPTKFKDFELEATYFRGINKQTVESQLKQSGLTGEEIARFKRSKKGK